MLSKDLLRHTFAMSERIVRKYLEDLSAEDLKLTPVGGMNPIAWQLGHLIGTEQMFSNAIQPGSAPALPEGFETAHRREAPGDPSGYLGPDDYLKLMDAQRANTLRILESLSEEELAGETPIERLRQMCPTIASTLSLTATHYIMHAGQWVAVRRSLGKAVAI